MIERPEYIAKLSSLKDKPIIKAITGIRRCGKSSVLDLYEEHLLKSGIKPKQIIRLNFEEAADEKYAGLEDPKKLYKYIKKRLSKDKMNYIILDEIQYVKGFQTAVDSLFAQKNTDIYITGSNSYLLSGELATLLSGRYIEIKMQPFSLKEYSLAYPALGKYELFQQYLAESSFPFALLLNNDRRNILAYLDSLFNTIIVKDIADRKGLMDTSSLKRVASFMCSNIGSLSSVKKIADTMSSDGQKISAHTVENYLSAFLDCYFMYYIPRYDIKGKEYLKTSGKYYLADIAFTNCIISPKEQDFGHILENIVCLELLRRGWRVFVGKSGNYEVDFTAWQGKDIAHFQVAWTAADKDVLERELRTLRLIKDHNPKYLLTMDALPEISHNGIKQINVLDWLL